jgi:hypothetical protein
MLITIRPLFSTFGSAGRLVSAISRSAALDLGVAAESLSLALKSVRRIAFAAGAHVDMPLTPPGGRSDFCIRVGALLVRAIRRLRPGRCS